jgi:hypothetical protein
MGRLHRLGIGMLILLLTPALSGCLSGDSILGISDDRGIPGSLTLACLDGSKYTSMVVEIDYEPGYLPESTSTDMLKQRLESVCDKSMGIRLVFTETDFAIDDVWSANDVRQLGEEAKSSSPQTGSTLTSVLGVAVDASTVAIFKDSIDDAENIFRRPSAEKIENSVLVHEVGHLLGLVNTVYTSPVDHEDSSHPGHSNNEDSVMYWAIESTSIANFFDNDLPTEFDSDDLNDLSGLADGSITCTDQLWRP